MAPSCETAVRGGWMSQARLGKSDTDGSRGTLAQGPHGFLPAGVVTPTEPPCRSKDQQLAHSTKRARLREPDDSPQAVRRSPCWWRATRAQRFPGQRRSRGVRRLAGKLAFRASADPISSVGVISNVAKWDELAYIAKHRGTSQSDTQSVLYVARESARSPNNRSATSGTYVRCGSSRPSRFIFL